MRKKILAGNWKMNTTIESGKLLLEQIVSKLSGVGYDSDKCLMLVAPPHTHTRSVAKLADDNGIDLAVQNITHISYPECAGELSSEIASIDELKAVIIGHSEMRKYFNETPETLMIKVRTAMSNSLKVIFCVGETLDEREGGNYLEIIRKQISDVIFKEVKKHHELITIAYEPVWAIGTGKVATPEQAQEVHAFIRKVVADEFGQEIADNMTLLYGGSCKRDNADGLFSKPDIDGGLIGGAALDADHFIDLYKILLKN